MASRRGILAGVIYHTVKVGNNQEEIFRSDADRKTYLELLERYKRRLRFALYGYVLLPDRVHLLIEPGPVELPRIMHALHSAYARYFNRNYGRSGHLFQGRYLAAPCTEMGRFWELLRWLHLHPVRTGLAQTARAFPWSSHGEYLEGQGDTVTDWQDVLPTLAPDLSQARRLYREIMATGVPEQCPGEVEGLAEIAATEENSIGSGRDRGDEFSLSGLVVEVARVTGTTPEKICSNTRAVPVVWARSLVAYIALRLGTWTAAEVARTLAKHPATVIRGAERVERELDGEAGELVRVVWRRLQAGQGHG